MKKLSLSLPLSISLSLCPPLDLQIPTDQRPPVKLSAAHTSPLSGSRRAETGDPRDRRV